MTILQFIYRSKMSTSILCVTVKIQFDSTSTFKYSTIPTLPLVAMLDPPLTCKKYQPRLSLIHKEHKTKLL